jgi:hypothetical protein
MHAAYHMRAGGQASETLVQRHLCKADVWGIAACMGHSSMYGA